MNVPPVDVVTDGSAPGPTQAISAFAASRFDSVDKTTGKLEHDLETSVVPWPLLIMVGFIVVGIVFFATAPGLTTYQRTVGIVVGIILGTIWSLILFYLWNTGKHATSWLVSLLPIVIYFIFFMSVISF